MPNSELTVREIFLKVAQGIKEHPERVAEVNSSFLFLVSGPGGGVFHLDLKETPGVTYEKKTADVTLEIRDRNLIKLYTGILPGYKAVLCGKLKVRGPIALVTKLSDVFFAARKSNSEEEG